MVTERQPKDRPGVNFYPPPLTIWGVNGVNFNSHRVYAQLRKLKAKSSAGPDKTPPIFLKHSALQLCSPLHFFYFNTLLTRVIFLTFGNLAMRTHIAKTISSCFAVLRQIPQLHPMLDNQTRAAQLLVMTLVQLLPKLDYGCSTLAGPPNNQLNRLQTLTPLLIELHWFQASDAYARMLS